MTHHSTTILRTFALSFWWMLSAHHPLLYGQAEQDALETSLESNASWVTSLAKLPDSADIVAASAQGLLLRPASVIRVSSDDLASLEPLYQHPTSVWAIAATSDLILSTDYGGTLGVFDRQSGDVQFYDSIFERWTRAVAIAPDGASMVAANEVGKLFVWSIAKRETTKTAEVSAEQIYCVAMSPDGTQLVACDGAGHVHVLGWPELNVLHDIQVGETAIWDVVYSPNSDTLIVGGADQTLWSVEFGGEEPVVREVCKTSDWIAAIEMTADDGMVLLGLLNGNLNECDLRSGSLAEVAKLESGVWDLLVNSPNQVLVASRKNALAQLGRTWTLTYEGTTSREESSGE